MCNEMFENMIRKMKVDSPLDFETLDWTALSSFKYLSEKFIEDFLYKLNIKVLCSHQILSENFLRKYKNIIDYKTISNTQISNVTYDFIFENRNKLDMVIIKKNKKYMNSLKNPTNLFSNISYIYKEHWKIIMNNLKYYRFFDDTSHILLEKNIKELNKYYSQIQDTNFFNTKKYNQTITV